MWSALKTALALTASLLLPVPAGANTQNPTTVGEAQQNNNFKYAAVILYGRSTTGNIASPDLTPILPLKLDGQGRAVVVLAAGVATCGTCQADTTNTLPVGPASAVTTSSYSISIGTSPTSIFPNALGRATHYHLQNTDQNVTIYIGGPNVSPTNFMTLLAPISGVLPSSFTADWTAGNELVYAIVVSATTPLNSGRW